MSEDQQHNCEEKAHFPKRILPDAKDGVRYGLRETYMPGSSIRGRLREHIRTSLWDMVQNIPDENSKVSINR